MAGRMLTYRLVRKVVLPTLLTRAFLIVFNLCNPIIMMYRTVCPIHCAHGLWSVKLTHLPLVPHIGVRQWTWSTLVQVMACRLSGAKPLPEPMPPYCQLHSYEHTSVKFESRYKTFHSWKCAWKCRLWNGGHFVQEEMSWHVLLSQWYSLKNTIQ